MVEVKKPGHSRHEQPWGTLAFCVVLSLMLHGSAAFLLELLPRSNSARAERPRTVRRVQVVRSTPEKKHEAPPPKPETPPPFAKTSADVPQRRPEQADFIGSHYSVASGEEDAPQRRSDAPLPTMAGRESEDEVVTFDQELQDGDVVHEGKRDEPPTPDAAPDAQDNAATPSQPMAEDSPDGRLPEAHPQGEGNEEPQPERASSAALIPTPPSPEGQLKLAELHTESALTLTQQITPPATLGHPEEEAVAPASAQPARRTRAAVYDPSLTAEAQLPGLRTYERRTRSTGRFVFGSRPALNVAATPRGRYEAEVYRRIARMWYAACNDHRGDIIPGSITISLRLSRNGSIDSMDLIRRRGASVIQQSFSFGAIRRAALPPMPAEVQQSIIGNLYEMILTFNFD